MRVLSTGGQGTWKAGRAANDPGQRRSVPWALHSFSPLGVALLAQGVTTDGGACNSSRGSAFNVGRHTSSSSSGRIGFSAKYAWRRSQLSRVRAQYSCHVLATRMAAPTQYAIRWVSHGIGVPAFAFKALFRFASHAVMSEKQNPEIVPSVRCRSMQCQSGATTAGGSGHAGQDVCGHGVIGQDVVGHVGQATASGDAAVDAAGGVAAAVPAQAVRTSSQPGNFMGW